MAEHANFETDDLIWGVEFPLLVITKHAERIRQLRQAYYEKLPGLTPAAARAMVDRTSGYNWIFPNHLVGVTSSKGQRWAHHRTITAYDAKTGELVGLGDMANNASSKRTGIKQLAQPFERQAKLHVPVEPFIQSRYGCVREVVGGDERRGFTLIAASVGIRECFRLNQALSSYPWKSERALKAALSQIGLHRNFERDEQTIEITPNQSVVQEPWVLERTSLVTPALALIPGALEALDDANVVHLHGA